MNLAFETNLLYLDVNNKRIGINVDNPLDTVNELTHDLTVNGVTRTSTIDITGGSVDIGDINISGNTITSSAATLNLVSSDGGLIVYQSKLLVDDLKLENNVISTISSNSNLELRPHGTGTVEIYGDTNVTGNITATGNISADGNIQIGSTNQSIPNNDTVTFNAKINSDIIPDTDDLRSLGSDTNRWKDLWVKNLVSDTISSESLIIDGIDVGLAQGNIWYVAVNGSDSNAGQHQNDPFATIKHAVETAAVSGDTVYVYPGVYEEQFPIEIPEGVTVHGVSLRSVAIRPTAATMYNDCFHMAGEATVEDFTIMGFYHDPAGVDPEYGVDDNGTGHAFRFHQNAKVISRSPYVRNISVLTYGTASVLSINSIKTEVKGTLTHIASIMGALVQGTPVTKTPSNPLNPNQSIDVSSISLAVWTSILGEMAGTVNYIIDHGTLRADLPTISANGTYATGTETALAAQVLAANKEFLKAEAYAYATTTYAPTVFDETVTKRDTGRVIDAFIYDLPRGGNEHLVYAGIGFWTHPTNDPRGYIRGDAGHGALVDGSVMDPDSKEAAMLFQSVTFITPAAETLIAKNGARIEWLNSFTYFANKSMLLTSGTLGFAGNGKTRIKITDTTGIWAVGNTLSYYDTDGTTVLASGVIESIDGDFYNIDGRVMSLVNPSMPGFESVQDRPQKTIVVHGGAKLSTAVKKFGTASLVLDGVGDFLTVPTQEDFAFGTGEFCVEMWVYRTGGSGAIQVLADFRSVNPQVVPVLYLSATNYYPSLTVNGATVISGTTTVPLNTWTHIAVAKSGTSTKIFMDGGQQGSTYSDTNNYIQGALTIGARFDGTTAFYGNIDDVSISKGTARYTTTFTVPTVQATGDLDTVLLLHFNGVDNSTAIADNGITLQDLRTSAGGRASIIEFADYSDFGAEIRSIGSASVYGEYGIWGDGPGVIAYLIGQNLAYIGNGGLSSNDPTSTIQPNEIVELNGAKIYYQSVDQNGDFRIGDLFYVNQATGEVSFANSNVAIGTSLTFDDGLGNVTFLDASKIETGDFRISGNTIQTLTQDFNVSSASNLINLESNVHITGSLDVVGNVTIGGNITIGDQTTDSVSFVAGVNSDILPTVTSTYNLGSPSLQWKGVYATEADIGSIQIESNIITTTDSNSNLELRAHGTGVILVPSNNVQLDQDLTVNGTTYVKNVDVTGTITQTGDVTQTGSLTQTGDINVTGTISVSGDAQFNDILISGNAVTTTVGNNDLNLSANGTGQVIVPLADVTITNDLTVNGLASINAFTTNNTITGGAFSTGDILISQNYITTTQTNSNLELLANGNGQIYVPSNDVRFGQALTVVGTTNTADINITGTVTHTGDTTQTGNTTQTGDFALTGNLTVGNTAQFTDIKIDNNVISTTSSNANLELHANGTGQVVVPVSNVTITNDLTVNGLATIDTFVTNNTVTAGEFSTGDILISQNNITTTQSNSNLVLTANGNGQITVPTSDVYLSQQLTVVGTTNTGDINITGTVTQTGDVTHTGNTTQTGDFNLTGNLSVSNTAQFTDIKIDNNVITTTTSNADLDLRASGTGRVLIPSNNVEVTNDLTVVGVTSTTTLNNTGTVTSGTFNTSDISITSNSISTTVSNSNLELVAAGTGKIYVPNNNVRFGQALTVVGTSTLDDTNITGTLTHIGATTQTGDTNQTGNFILTGNLTVGNTAQFKDIKIDNNVITTTLLTDLELRASGTGRIFVPSNNVTIEQNLTVTGTTTTTTINNSGTVTAATFNDGDITINGNTIRTTATNSNLQLQAAGTGFIELEQFEIQDNTIRISASNTDMVLQPNGTGIVSINSTQALKLPVGNNTQRPTAAAGMVRFNSELSRYEGYNGTTWVRLDGVEDADGNTKITAELTPGANDNTIRFYTNGTQVADLTSTRFNVNSVVAGNLNLSNNTISTTGLNQNLVLTPSGTGSVRTGNFSFKDNTITNTVNNSITNINHTGNGYFKINSTGGFVIPAGLTEQRPVLFAVGMMRYNTDPGNFRVEVWDGSNWVNAGQGAGGGVSVTEAEDIGILSAIIFG